MIDPGDYDDGEGINENDLNALSAAIRELQAEGVIYLKSDTSDRTATSAGLTAIAGWAGTLVLTSTRKVRVTIIGEANGSVDGVQTLVIATVGSAGVRSKVAHPAAGTPGRQTFTSTGLIFTLPAGSYTVAGTLSQPSGNAGTATLLGTVTVSYLQVEDCGPA